MKKTILIFIFIVLAIVCNAQNLQLLGKVVDDNDNPVEFAEILLLQNNTVLQSQLTDETGQFLLRLLQGKFSMIIRQLGDTLYMENIDITQTVDLGIVKVQLKSNMLQEITVTAQKKIIERRTDKMVFNVASMPGTKSSDVMELFRVVPGVVVSNNAIAIVGKGSVSVMINGRSIKFSGDELANFLRTLRADDVQKIEVVTTPPAKYDAEGNLGLINIVMKKTTIDTWNAAVFGNYRQAEYAHGSLGGSFNYQRKALSFYANASYGNGKSYMDDEGVIFYPTLKWENKGDYTNRSNSFNSRIGFDVDIYNNWTVGAQYIGSLGSSNNHNNNHTALFNITDNSDAGLIATKTSGASTSGMHSGNIHSTVQLDSLGRKINVDFDILSYNANSDAIYKSNTDGSTDIQIPNGFASAGNILDRKITNYAAQIDVEHPIKIINLNYGVKLSFTRTNNNIQVNELSTGVPVNDPDQTNKFLYDEKIQAFYVSGNTQLGKWGIQVGLRAENTQFTGNSVTMDTVFNKSYFEIFPTAFFTFNPNEANIFYTEYSRRINRPGFSHLNPFRSYSSPYYYFAGNPELRPMFTDNLSIGYVYNYQFQLAFDYSRDKDNFGGGVVILDKDGYTQKGTRLNYLDGYSVGGRIVYVFNKLSWWMSQNTLSAYYQHSESKIYPLTPKSSDGYEVYFYTNNIFYFNKKQTVSAGFDLSIAPAKTSNLNYHYAQKNLNAFVKMLFFDNQLSVTLTANNLLREYSFNWRGESNGILQYSRAYYEPRFFRLSVSYSFGSKKINVVQRKVSNEEEKGRLN